MNRITEKKPCFDGNKIKGKMRELKMTQDFVAQKLRINKSTFNLKVNGQMLFSQDEIAILLNLLNIPDDKIKDYFFEEKV